MLPTITIRYSPLMDRYGQILSQGEWAAQYKKILGDIPYPLPESLIETAAAYRAEWQKYESVILTGITDLLGLHFSEREITVYVIGFGRAHSDPLVVPSNISSADVVGLITHEVLHRLLTHNHEGFFEDVISPKLFPEETSSAALHIVIHAIMEYVYRDIIGNEDSMQRDINRSTQDYRRAWDVVSEFGYKNVIEKIRSCITESNTAPIAR